MEEDKKRNIHYEFGKFAENIAAEYYIKNGYAILERNWRLNKIEIDIIAQKDNIVAFVEVKARNGKDQDPIDAVNNEKKRRMAKGADAYLKSFKGYYEYRFDIFALTGDFQDYKIEILEDAFLAPLSTKYL